jgi:nucleoside-diphosphate-sugar epimerase
VKKPQIFLTGASGFIGRAVAAELTRRGLSFEAPTSSELDLTDEAAVRVAYGQSTFDLVLHFASRGVQAKSDDETIPVHEAAMAKALIPLVRAGGKILYAGSMAEYGRSGRLSEEMKCNPQNAYAHAKHETGNWLRRAAVERGVRAVVARIFGAYGPGEAPSRLFPSVLAALRQGRPVELSDGLQVRDFIHVADVARVTLDLALHRDPPTCINVGTGVGLTVREVVTRLAEQLHGDQAMLYFGKRSRSPHDQQELVADVALLEATLGTTPPQRLESGTLLDLV